MMSIVPILGNEKLIPEKPHINMCDPPKFHKIMGGYDAVPRNYYSIYRGSLDSTNFGSKDNRVNRGIMLIGD